MRGRLAILFLLGVCLVFALLFARQVYLSRGLPHAAYEPHRVHVLTYATFLGASGPGGRILDRFKKAHDCEVDVTTVDDAGLLLARLKLEPADVVIGLDESMLAAARAQTSWHSLEAPRGAWYAEIPRPADFVPIDWSPMTFIYRKEEIEPPRSLDDLLSSRFKNRIALEAPRASSPGRMFYAWISQVKGNGRAEYLARLKPNVQSVSPSWAFAYGLFAKRQAALVFSYLTSLAFHWGTEHDRSYQAVSFPEAHPVQVEFAGVPNACHECALGEELARSLDEPPAQMDLMQRNFMLPVLKGFAQGTVYAELPALKTIHLAPEAGADLRDWDQVFPH